MQHMCIFFIIAPLKFNSVTREQEAEFMLWRCETHRWPGCAFPKGCQPWELREAWVQPTICGIHPEEGVFFSNFSTQRRRLFLMGGMPFLIPVKIQYLPAEALWKPKNLTHILPISVGSHPKVIFACFFNKNWFEAIGFGVILQEEDTLGLKNIKGSC